MREIKFRFWDVDEEILVYLGDYYVYAGCDGYLIGIGKDKLIFEDRCPHSAGIDTEDIGDRYIVTWYTGLRDKNGKEIYEGDILQTDEDQHFDGVVEYDEEYGTWNYSYAILEFADEPNKYWGVIGNIYENPELLEDK